MSRSETATLFTEDPIEEDPEAIEIGLSVVDEDNSAPAEPSPDVERLVRVAHFMNCVDSVDHQQDETFHHFLNEGMDLAKLIDDDVAAVIGVKPSAVARWSEGSKPREWTRRCVYRYLREQVAEKL